MRIRLVHSTRYRYSPPAKGAIQLLRLTPRSHETQHVRFWRIEIDRDCVMKASEDFLGNVTHGFNVEGPLVELSIAVEGEVDVDEGSGVVRGTPEPFPPTLFLRETALTCPSSEIRAMALETSRQAGGDRLAMLHALMSRLHDGMTFEPEVTDAGTSAAQAFALGHGVCQDFAHVYLAAARCCGVPARYVSGYLLRDDGRTSQQAGHAWVEAHVEGLGWVGFDPANGVCPSENYLRIAVGMDYLGAAPVRGARQGGGDESLTVHIEVANASRQSQS